MKPTRQKALWLRAGGFLQSRLYALLLPLQVKRVRLVSLRRSMVSKRRYFLLRLSIRGCRETLMAMSAILTRLWMDNLYLAHIAQEVTVVLSFSIPAIHV